MRYAPILWLVSASAALAHPGHESPVADGAGHWLAHGDHLAVIVGGVVFVWLALDTRPIAALRRKLRRE